MATIVFSDELKFDGGVLPAHLASDRQIYVLVDDLCNFIGLESDGMADRIQHDISTADVLLFMVMPEDVPPPGQEPRKAAFLNLAALPYWLGKISPEEMNRPDLHDQLVRYTFDFLDTSWMLYRAAAYDLERTGITWTGIGARGNRKRLPGARPNY